MGSGRRRWAVGSGVAGCRRTTGINYGTVAAATCNIHWKTSGGHSGFTAGYSWAWNTVVQRGDRGDIVREIQCVINNHAYYDGPKLTADGDYGAKTETAVRGLQANWSAGGSHPVSVDGMVGPQTRRALRAA
ncbi:peptidoglycan-binding protein [Streptomyces sp. NPDC020490]|uniref:peptidoglycan-binding protein n=1 Tax=Streptomyces sp. NPDC020490 TaxID=3365078 RepID=UPI0037A705E9